MKRIILIILLFNIFFLFSQGDIIKIILFDTTEDYWKDFYKNHYEEIDKQSKINFKIIENIELYYICPASKYFREFRLININIYDNNTFMYGNFRGFKFFGNYYFFETLDFYKLRYDFEIQHFLITMYHTDVLGKINYMGKGICIAKTRIADFENKLVKYIDFYGIHDDYIERYLFSIILKNNCN